MTSPMHRAAIGPAVALLLALSSTLVLISLPMPSRATPEPPYKVLRTLGDVELRAYAAYAVAEVTVPGPAGEAGNQAFPILAGYIFGKNKGDRKLAMTTPVTQTLVPVKLEMAAPVVQAAAPGGFRVQFTLPEGVTVSSAPNRWTSASRCVTWRPAAGR